MSNTKWWTERYWRDKMNEQRQISEEKKRVAELQAAIEECKRKYAGVIPSPLDPYFKPMPAPGTDAAAEPPQLTEVARLRGEVYNLKRKHQALQRAIDSVVLRLKVLDLEQMEKEQGADGTVPLRFAISELKKLVAAFDGTSECAYDEGWQTTIAQPYGIGGLAGTKYPDITYTSSSTGGTHGNY